MKLAPGFAGLFLLGVQPAHAGTVLWRDIEVGMPAARVQELYPAVKGAVRHTLKSSKIEGVQQVGRCHPDVEVKYAAGLVEKVVITSRLRGFPKESCGDEAANAMLSKYGPPMAEDEDRQQTGGLITKGLFRGLDTTHTERETRQTWLRDGVLITFERDDPEGDDSWSITYQVQQDIGL